MAEVLCKPILRAYSGFQFTCAAVPSELYHNKEENSCDFTTSFQAIFSGVGLLLKKQETRHPLEAVQQFGEINLRWVLVMDFNDFGHFHL